MKNGDRKIFKVADREILLVQIAEQFFAVNNRCTHLDYPLVNGRLVGFEIMCRKHGACFNLRSGRAVHGPAVRPLEIYKTAISDGMIAIEIP